MTRALALPALLIFASALAQASSIVPVDQNRASLGTYIEVLEDPGGHLTLEDVRKPPQAARFRHSAADPLNFGYSNSAWWLRFRLPRGAPPDDERLLELAYPSLDRVEFYLPEALPGTEPRYVARVAGDTLPWAARAVRHRNHVFRFALPTTADEGEYYMRVTSQGEITVPLTLWRPDAFAEHERNSQLILGLFYGVALALVLYNLMLFFAVRDRAYMYYVLYAIAFGIFLFSFDGLGYQYLWPRSPWAANHIVAVALTLTLAFGMQFARAFLDTHRIAPLADRTMGAIAAAGALLAVFAATDWVIGDGGVLRTVS
ncbi:MAG: 7TM-DISM domain-containing protein, partial [Burkholderiales bacterium]